ncbi:MAG: hypothetical protein HGA76_10990, partial [Candidatus Firestonebacteria bacterium]|nr:hypothetical protein [Candidatus Firestonebacteria bacterium]
MRKIFFGVLGCLGLVSQAYALGINYGEILVENLQIGTTYNLTEIANLPLEVNNDSDEAMTIQAEPLKPDKPIAGYEAVPSVAWIKISPAKFPMQPRVKHLSDVHITIPQDRKYLGRKYQVDIFTHSAENADGMNFMSVKLGIKGRLLFTVAPVVL